MRASDLVAAIQAKIPSLVDDFTTQKSISAITIATAFDGTKTILQVTTISPHLLSNNMSVFLKGVFFPIDITSFTRNGIVGTVTTTQVHDLSNNSQANVTIQDANEAEFNGSFKLLNVSNRNTFTVLMTDAGPVTATGSIKSPDIGGTARTIAGLQAVSSANSATTFLYEVLFEVTEVINNSGTINSQPRVTASISLERFIEDSYTKQSTDEGWICVVIGDSTANKSRRQDIDSTDNIQRTQYFNQKFAQIVEVFVVLPTTSEISARKARDRCEELLQPICQCILFKKFDSLVSAGFFNPLQFTGAGFEQYNTAYYAHRYSFEITVQMQFEDTSGFEDDVAFRDIGLTINPSTGNESLTALIDLDESPV